MTQVHAVLHEARNVDRHQDHNLPAWAACRFQRMQVTKCAAQRLRDWCSSVQLDHGAVVVHLPGW